MKPFAVMHDRENGGAVSVVIADDLIAAAHVASGHLFATGRDDRKFIITPIDMTKEAIIGLGVVEPLRARA